MNAWGTNLLLFPTIFYFFVLLFNEKSLKWYYIIHTIIVFFIISNMLWSDWGDWFIIENNFDDLGFFSTILICVIFVLVLTQTHRKSHSEILKKEIWGEWAKYEKNNYK